MRKFLVCKHCGNIAGLIEDKNVPLVCCGEKMAELAVNSADASAEKHLPVVTVSGGTVEVKIGEAPHPMESAHNIAFVYVETRLGGQRKRLENGAEPKVTFKLSDDEPKAVYAYCNLHGLWKTEL